MESANRFERLTEPIMKQFLCACSLLLAALLAACEGEPTPIAVVEATAPPSPTASESLNTTTEGTGEEPQAPATEESMEPTVGVEASVATVDPEARKSEREMMVAGGVIGWGGVARLKAAAFTGGSLRR